jgi:hypothetical protein
MQEDSVEPGAPPSATRPAGDAPRPAQAATPSTSTNAGADVNNQTEDGRHDGRDGGA